MNVFARILERTHGDLPDGITVHSFVKNGAVHLDQSLTKDEANVLYLTVIGRSPETIAQQLELSFDLIPIYLEQARACIHHSSELSDAQVLDYARTHDLIPEKTLGYIPELQRHQGGHNLFLEEDHF